MPAITLALWLATLVAVCAFAPDRALTRPGGPTVLGTPSRAVDARPPGSVSVYRGHDAAYWAHKFRVRSAQYRHVRAQLRQRWQPTVTYALRLASAVFGVSYWELYRVSACESNHFPGATNGRYKGLFQLGWSPFGLSPYDPVANALSAAQTVRADGSWRQWECKP